MTQPLLIEDIDEWITTCLKDYDIALQDLEMTKVLPNDGEAECIVYLGKLKRAERLLTQASIRADAASMVQILKNSNVSGEIYLNLPDIQINIKLKW